MPFPYIFHENFETGTAGGFTDTPGLDPEGRITFPDHNDQLEIKPWRGGYCMRVDLNRGGLSTGGFLNNDCFIENTAVLNMVNPLTRYLRFYMYVSTDFRMPQGASLTILRCSSVGPAEEFGIGISRSDPQINTPRLSIHSVDDGEYIDGLDFTLGQWIPIQVVIMHNGASSRIFLHHLQNTIQAQRLSFASFTSLKLGSMAQHVDVRGTLYFDDFIIDSAKLEEPAYLTQDEMSGQSQLYTKSTYAFVGPGNIRGATLISGGTDNLAYFHDADRLPLAHHDIKAALRCSSPESKDTLIETIHFRRGCYIAMSGANPQVIVHYGALTGAELMPEIA